MASERNIPPSSMGGQRSTQGAGSSADDLKGRAEEALSDAAEQAQTMAPRLRDATADAIDAKRGDVAGVIERAASAIEERTGEGGTMPEAVADRAAGGMHTAAGYLRDHQTAEMLDDVEGYVKAHPMRSLVGAVAAGFLVARVLR